MSILQEALRRKHQDSSEPSPALRPAPAPLPPPRRGSSVAGWAGLVLVAVALGWWAAERWTGPRAAGPAGSPAPATVVVSALPPVSAPASPALSGPVQRARETVAAVNRVRQEGVAETSAAPPPAPEAPAPAMLPTVVAEASVPPAAVSVPAETPSLPVGTEPVAPAPAPPAAPEISWPDLRVQGVVSGAGGSPTVILEKLGLFECGETVPDTDGAVIAEIRPDGITLRRGDATRVYRIGKR